MAPYNEYTSGAPAAAAPGGAFWPADSGAVYRFTCRWPQPSYLGDLSSSCSLRSMEERFLLGVDPEAAADAAFELRTFVVGRGLSPVLLNISALECLVNDRGAAD